MSDITHISLGGQLYDLPGGGTTGDYIVNQYTKTVGAADWLVREYKSGICEIYGTTTTSGHMTSLEITSRQYPVTFKKIYYKNTDAIYIDGQNAIAGVSSGTGALPNSLTETGVYKQYPISSNSSGVQKALVFFHVIGTI